MKVHILAALLVIAPIISSMSLTKENHQEKLDCYAIRMGMHPVYSSVGANDWRVNGASVLDSPSFAWVPSNGYSPDQWIEVGSPVKVKWIGVVTQGRPLQNYQHWVKSYQVLYSNDGVSWDEVDSGRIFKGNSDRNTHVKHWFREPVTARSIRLVPKSWNTIIALRLDFIYEC